MDPTTNPNRWRCWWEIGDRGETYRHTMFTIEVGPLSWIRAEAAVSLPPGWVRLSTDVCEDGSGVLRCYIIDLEGP
jgi:hypothetical protein